MFEEHINIFRHRRRQNFIFKKIHLSALDFLGGHLVSFLSDHSAVHRKPTSHRTLAVVEQDVKCTLLKVVLQMRGQTRSRHEIPKTEQGKRQGALQIKDAIIRDKDS